MAMQYDMKFKFHPGTQIIMANPVLLSCGHSVEPELTKKIVAKESEAGTNVENFVCPCCKKFTKVTAAIKDLSTRESILQYLQKNGSDWDKEKVHFSLSLQMKIRRMLATDPIDSKKLLNILQRTDMDPRIFIIPLSDGKSSVTLFNLLCEIKVQCSSELFAFVWEKASKKINSDKYFDIAESLIKNNKTEFAARVVNSTYEMKYNFKNFFQKLLEELDYKKLSILLKIFINSATEEDAQNIRDIFDYAVKYEKCELLLMLQNNGVDLLREIKFQNKPNLRSDEVVLDVFNIFLTNKKYEMVTVLFHGLLLELESTKDGADHVIMGLLMKSLERIDLALYLQSNTLQAIVNTPCKFQTYEEISPILYTLLTNRGSLACKLIRCGASIEQVDKNNRNVLYLAHVRNMQDVIDAIIEAADKGKVSMVQLLQRRDKFGTTVLNLILSQKNITFEKLKKFIEPIFLRKFQDNPKLLLHRIFAPVTVAGIFDFDAAASCISSEKKKYSPELRQKYLTDGLQTAMSANNIKGIDFVLSNLTSAKETFHFNYTSIVQAILQDPAPKVSTLRHVYDKAISKKIEILDILFYVCGTSTEMVMIQCKKDSALVSKIFNKSCSYQREVYSAFDLFVRVRPQAANIILSEIVANNIDIGEANIKPIFLHAISLGNMDVAGICFKKLYPEGNVPAPDVDNIVALVKTKGMVNPESMLHHLVCEIGLKISEQAKIGIMAELGDDVEYIFANTQSKAPAAT